MITNYDKAILFIWYVKPNEKMAISKFQMSMLTFYLSAKVSHIGVTSMYIKTVFFQKPLGQLNSNFIIMETLIVERSKIITSNNGHMTKMAALKISFSRTRRPMALWLGLWHCKNDESWLTLTILVTTMLVWFGMLDCHMRSQKSQGCLNLNFIQSITLFSRENNRYDNYVLLLHHVNYCTMMYLYFFFSRILS